MNELIGDDPAHKEVVVRGEIIDSAMSVIENQLYQTKLKSNQDMLNYPIMLNNKLAHVASLASMSNNRPTDQMYAVRDDLTEKINELLAQWNEILNKSIPAYNELIRKHNINVIGIPNE